MRSPRPSQRSRSSLFRVGVQLLVLILLAAFVIWCGSNLAQNQSQRGFTLRFDFLDNPAGFTVTETVIPYSSRDTYAKALLVGFLNTLRVTAAGLVLATVLGISVGLGRLSRNWLVRKLALIYVETLRNLPLLLVLVFGYAAVLLSLPPADRPLSLGGLIFLQRQGTVIPWGVPTDSFWVGGGAGLGGMAAAIACLKWLTRRREQQGGLPLFFWGLPLVVLLLPMGLALLYTQGELPLILSVPRRHGTVIEGGLKLAPEFLALLLPLSLYSAAFIAEIVRAGVTAVPRGQREAAQSLGLPGWLVMARVIFPQALRVIVPPLTSQYLNLAKNTSLGVAVGFPDLYAIASPTLNQTGRPVEVLLLLMLTYLSLSLILSLAMNLYNRTLAWEP
ncbi:ABC transporter permease subunit [Lyngbya confervoides]|uniref:ABC transporter permease subunit n=1 Tax=Lyngbya confervoides BDU141951 TaxID=1574623 RepID=A0ABD4TB29_9CYAN|nr:ABC transporter permease subunit [Lyngbya confervoides]MCM1985195.1 ABC transporter permease subunit [Lyngbya confervoides BDU141951]